MVRRLLAHTRANAVGYAALFVALGGTSYAAVRLPARSVGSRELKARAVTSTKLARGAVTARAVRAHSLRAVDFAPGVVRRGARGPAGVAGPQGATGAAGAAGTARAYGLVAKDGTVDVTRSKNVASVTKPASSTGVYCIALTPGIDASTVAPVATIDYNPPSGPQSDLAALAQIWSNNSVCPAGRLTVLTRAVQSTSAGTAAAAPATDENFFFVVP